MAMTALQPLLKTVGMAQSRFLHGLEKTPDDRLNWRPSETAGTPLQIAGKLAGFLGVMAQIFQERTMPERPPTPPPPPASREEATAAITAAHARLQSAIDRLSEPDLGQTVTMPWGTTVAIGELIWSVTGVLGYWQGQLNYIQTVYGDMDPNMPPDWGRH